MFDENDVIGAAVGRCLVLLRDFKRGDVLPWKRIESAAGFERYSTHWTQFLKRVRRDFLASSGITLWPVSGVGLKLHTHQEQLHDRDLSRQRRALRQQSKNVAELRATPDHELTDHQREAKARKLENARAGRKKILAGVRLAHALMRPSSSGVPRAKPATKAA